MKSKLISLTVFAVMVSVISLKLNAQTYSGGSGIPADPYLIANKTDLKYLSENSGEWGKDFRQSADISFTAVDFQSGGDFYNGGAGFIPIGNNSVQFTGSYNGDGHTISGLTINRPSTDYVGMFGRCNNGNLQNIHLSGVDIIGGSVTGGLAGIVYYTSLSGCSVQGVVSGESSVGGLIGIATNLSIYLCISAVEVTATGNNSGGLAGYIEDEVSITESYASGAVNGTDYVGGLVGFAIPYSNINIQKSFATGDVSGTECVGGFAGCFEVYANLTVTDCYTRGNVFRESTDGSALGGFIGYSYYGTIQRCYSTGSISGAGWAPTDKGFAGIEYGSSFSYNYWDTQSSGQTSSAGQAANQVEGRTTAQMKQQATFVTWDFVNTWRISSITNNGYPFHAWQCQTRKYVTVSGAGSFSGDDWANALNGNQLQAAINDPCATEVWIAAGTYHPTDKVGGTEDRHKTFQMRNGITIYGGFAGNESAIAERTDFGPGGAHETILSGDLNDNDITTSYPFQNTGENCYHVFFHPLGKNLDNTAILDGVTISGGNANSGYDPHYLGGGMFNYGSSPKLNNITFRYNSASEYYGGGGAIYMRNSSPVATNITVQHNSSAYGGGIYLQQGCEPSLINWLISDNTADIYGGGIYNANAYAISFNNATISNNHSVGQGGGLYNGNYSIYLNNCIIWGNTAVQGNQVHNATGNSIYLQYSCIANGTGDVTYTGVPVTWDGNTIQSDPQFADPGNGDFRLKGNSPCADAGNDAFNTLTTDIRGTGFGRKLLKSNYLQSGPIDMGAYEYNSDTDTEGCIPPVITCPVVNNPYPANTTGCKSSQSFAASATDNCGTATIRYFIGQDEIFFPYEFPLGTTTVTATAYDAVEPPNTDVCTFDVEVVNSLSAYDVSLAPGALCLGAGSEIMLSGSQSGSNFQYFLYENNVLVDGSMLTGTGGELTWVVSPLTDKTYTVKATDTFSGCELWMNGSADVYTSPITTIPDMYHCPGIIEVPVLVTNFHDIGAISLTLNYDLDVLSIVDDVPLLDEGDSYIDDAGLIDYFHADESGLYGTLRLSGIPVPEASLDDDEILVTLRFHYTGGTTTLTWDDSDDVWCEYGSFDPDYIPFCDDPPGSYYIDGTITQYDVLVISCPAAVDIAACLPQDDINDAYAAWVNGFGYTGGFGVDDNIDDVPVLPADAQCAGAELSFTYIVTDVCGTSSCSSTFTVNPCQAAVEGNVKYFNPPAYTSIQNATIALYQGGLPVYGPVAVTGGNYSIGNVCPGTYDVVISKMLPTGSINATDAAQVNSWATAAPKPAIEKVRFYAGDVVGNGVAPNNTVTPTDALAIQLYFVTGGASGFERGPWSFWKAGDFINTNPVAPIFGTIYPQITVNLSNVTVTQNFYGLVTGDMNGSYVPLSKNFAQNLELVYGENTRLDAGTEFELPIRVTSEMTVGAASLILYFPPDLVEITGVEMKSETGSLDWMAEGGELRAGWNSLDPLWLAAGSELLSIHGRTTESFSEGDEIRFNLAPDPLNELADGNFNVIPGALLQTDVLAFSTTGTWNPGTLESWNGLTLKCRPNPFAQYTMLNYQLEKEGRATLEITDMLGRRVALLVDEWQTAGEYSMKLDAAPLQPGMYTAVLRLETADGDYVKTIKLISNR